MKKLYTLIIAAFGMIAMNGQNLPNGGFENWTLDTAFINNDTWITFMDAEGAWPEVNKYIYGSTDAQEGSSSVYLETIYDSEEDDTVTTYLLQGQLDEGPIGGIAYTSDIDSICGYYKSGLMAGDSGNVIVFMYSATDTTQQIMKIGGTTTSWTYFSFKLDTFDSGNIPPTEVFLGVTSSEIGEDVLPIPGSWMMYDNISFKSVSGTPALIPDYSFEDWAPVTIEKS